MQSIFAALFALTTTIGISAAAVPTAREIFSQKHQQVEQKEIRGNAFGLEKQEEKIKAHPEKEKLPHGLQNLQGKAKLAVESKAEGKLKNKLKDKDHTGDQEHELENKAEGKLKLHTQKEKEKDGKAEKESKAQKGNQRAEQERHKE